MLNKANSNWEALPPRQRKKRDDTAQVQPPEVAPEGGRMKAVKLQQILDNIEARKQALHHVNTLSSKDGCAGQFYEYLDHTADVQCHAWGDSMQLAFQHMAPCMMNYMTDLALIAEDREETLSIEVEGHDLQSLLYNYMNEILFKFSSDSFCTVRAEIIHFDRDKFTISASLYGDIFDPTRHSSGTEIKAITYSNMQIHDTPERVDLYVIVDI